MRTGLAITEDVVISSQRIQQTKLRVWLPSGRSMPGHSTLQREKLMYQEHQQIKGYLHPKRVHSLYISSYGCSTTASAQLGSYQLLVPELGLHRTQKPRNTVSLQRNQESFTERRKSKAPGAKCKDPQLHYSPAFAQWTIKAL